MAATFLHLLLVLLAFSHLICFNAIPVTRTQNLMHEYSRDPEVLDNTHLGNTENRWEVQTIIGRMNVELNDYPGSGANNRHTPKPPPGRGCADC